MGRYDCDQRRKGIEGNVSGNGDWYGKFETRHPASKAESGNLDEGNPGKCTNSASEACGRSV